MKSKYWFYNMFIILLGFTSVLSVQGQVSILIEYINVPEDKLEAHDHYQTNTLEPYHQMLFKEKKIYAWYHYACRFPAGQRDYNRLNVTVLADKKYREAHDAVSNYKDFLWDIEVAQPDYQLRSPDYGTLPAPYITVDFLRGFEQETDAFSQFLKQQVKPLLDKKVQNHQLLNWSVFRFANLGARPKSYDGVIVSRYDGFSDLQNDHPLQKGNPGKWIKSEAWKLLNLVYQPEKKGTGFQNDTVAIKKTIHSFIQAIDTLSEAGVAASYAPDADAFYPHGFAPTRLDGSSEIMTVQNKGFDQIRSLMREKTKLATFSIGLTPKDMTIRILGDKSAVVSWHSPRPNHIGRRTAVLRKEKGQWLIVHMHASNVAKEE